MLWEIGKAKIKEYTIGYCTKKRTIKKNVLKELEKEIENKEES